jgi:hypothetical protein
MKRPKKLRPPESNSFAKDYLIGSRAPSTLNAKICQELGAHELQRVTDL